MMSQMLIAVLVIANLNLVLSFGRVGRLEALARVLEDQMLEISESYRDRLSTLNRNYDNLNYDMEHKYRILNGEFHQLNVQYNSLVRRYEKYEDRCIPEQKKKQFAIDDSRGIDFTTYSHDLYYSQNTYRNKVELGGQKTSLAVNSTKPGWALVFRANRGNDRNVYDDWISTGSYKPFYEDCDRAYCYTCGNWRSYLVDEWENLGIRKVKIELYENDARVAWFEFDGVGSTMTDWFTEDRLTDTNYDIVGDTMSAFDINDLPRFTFHISEDEPGNADCSGEHGYFRIHQGQRTCTGRPINGNPTHIPAFVYSKIPEGTNWFDDVVGFADVFTIWIEFNDVLVRGQW